MKRALFFVLGLFVAICSGYQHWIVNTRGFPDGYIPEVDRVLIPYDLAIAYLLLSIGLWTVIHTIFWPSQRPPWVWWAALILVAAAYVARSPYENYLATFLLSSSGG